MSLYVFAVDDPRDCRNVKAGLISYILEHHRFKARLVPIQKIVVLILQYGLHSLFKRIFTLLERFHKPFCGVYLLLDKCQCLLLGLSRSPLRVVQHLRIAAAHPYFRH